MVGDGDVLLGQGLEVAVALDVLLDTGGLVGGNALGEFPATAEALQDKIGAAAGGAAAGGREELPAEHEILGGEDPGPEEVLGPDGQRREISDLGGNL